MRRTGRAKYTFDTNRPRMLWAKFATCPFGHAKVKSVDTSVAEKMPGVVVVEVLAAAGAELRMAFAEVAVVAAHARAHGLASACRVVLNMNEFVFVD